VTEPAASVLAAQQSLIHDGPERGSPWPDQEAMPVNKQVVGDKELIPGQIPSSIPSSQSLKREQLSADSEQTSQIFTAPYEVSGRSRSESIPSGGTQRQKVELQRQRICQHQRDNGIKKAATFKDGGSSPQKYANEISVTSTQTVDSKSTNSSNITLLRSGSSSSSFPPLAQPQTRKKEDLEYKKTTPLNPREDDFATRRQKHARFR